MPFNPNGTYTPPTGATTAIPGATIYASVWNSIFEDISEALTQLGQQIFIPTPTIVAAAGIYNVAVSDTFLIFTGAVTTINLPPSASKEGMLRIMGGASGVFSSSNGVITPYGTEKISGLSNITLTQDYQAITLYPVPSGGYVYW